MMASGHWGDYNNKLPTLWDRRDLWNALYGTPPMFMFNRRQWRENKERFVQSYHTATPVARATGCEGRGPFFTECQPRRTRATRTSLIPWPRRKSREADALWLRVHKKSPIVQAAMTEVRRSRAFIDVTTGRGYPKFGNYDDMQAYSRNWKRWMERRENAVRWLGE